MINIRLCIVCKKYFHKKDLLCLKKIRSQNTISFYNPTGKGIYICNKGNCIEKFLKQKKYKERYLKITDNESLNELKDIFKKNKYD
jgi:predicted RNA-binding protein YlxR (DUF448 family)